MCISAHPPKQKKYVIRNEIFISVAVVGYLTYNNEVIEDPSNTNVQNFVINSGFCNV